MVIAERAVGWSRRMLGAIGDDLRGFRAAVRSRRGACLRRYELDPSQGKRRFHLRFHDDGSALLLVDVADAIHLNPAAAFLADLALQGVSVGRAAALLRGRFRAVGRLRSRTQAETVYALVGRLTAARGPCATCGATEVQWSPLFSLPVAAPYKADLALTYRCNNACPHCYSKDRDQRQRLGGGVRPLLSMPQWRRVLRRLAKIGVPHVIFTGGEPTLFEGLCELVGVATRLGLVAGLNTNGRRLSDASFVRSLEAAGLDHVQITLESHRPEVHNAMTAADSFSETVGGVRNALSGGLHALTNTTLTERNIDHAGQTVEFLHSLGLRTFAMNGMIHAGGGCGCRETVPVERLAPVLADVRDRARALGMRFLWYTPTEYCRLSPVEWELGPRRCNAGEYSMCIEPNGDVLPCQSYYVPAGNLLDDPWERIWQSELFLSFRRRAADPRACGLPERCWSCPDLPLCAGGCRLERGEWRGDRGEGVHDKTDP